MLWCHIPRRNEMEDLWSADLAHVNPWFWQCWLSIVRNLTPTVSKCFAADLWDPAKFAMTLISRQIIQVPTEIVWIIRGDDCTVGGLFALGASSSADAKHDMNLAADIAHTCHESYDRAGVNAVSLRCIIFDYWNSVVIQAVNSVACLTRKTGVVMFGPFRVVASENQYRGSTATYIRNAVVG